MVLPPTQYQATRELDDICDMRVSIGHGEYVDSDPWGRGKASSVRFPTRAAAERTLSSIATTTTTPPQLVNTAAHRALRSSRLRQAAQAAQAASPPALYQQPPKPPRHLQLRDSSRDHPPPPAPPLIADVPAPPPRRTLPQVQSAKRSTSALSDKTSEPPSFANMRDLSIASSFGRSPPGNRRPRGSANGTGAHVSPNKQAALADYLELSEEALVQRVFDDDNEPVSVPGSGSVASVPQTPFKQQSGIKKWIGKKAPPVNGDAHAHAHADGAQPASAGAIDSLWRKSSSKKVRDSLSRLLLLDAAPAKDDIHQPLTPPGPASGKSLPLPEPPSAASLEEETPPPTAVYEMVTLKTNIPDRPRASDTAPFDDALEFFDDVGDVAIGDAADDVGADFVHDMSDEAGAAGALPGDGRIRPQLKEQLISSIKSYHGPEDYDDDDYGDGEYTDEDESTTTTEHSYTANGRGGGGGNPLKSDAVFEESHITHTFSQPSNLQLSGP